MISGPVMIQVLEGENAIAKNRELMGATDPKKAEKGTIRADFADSIDANAVHGSDAPETAAVEVAFFFPGDERLHRAESLDVTTVNLLDFDLDAAGRLLRAAWVRSGFAPPSCSAGSTRRARPTSRR